MFYGGGRDDMGSGGRGGGGRNRNDRYEQMTKQQQLIEIKKQEIQKRLEEERHKKTMEALLMGSSKSSSTGSSSSSTTSSSAPASSRHSYRSQSIKSEDNFKSNSFENDGSFLEKFRRLQEEKEKEKKKKEAKLAKVEPDEYGYGSSSTGRPPLPSSLKTFDPNAASNENANTNLTGPPSLTSGNYNNNSSSHLSYPPPKYFGNAPPLPPVKPPLPPSTPQGRVTPPPARQQYMGFGYQNVPPPPPPPPLPPFPHPTSTATAQFQTNSQSQSQPQHNLNQQSLSVFPSEKVKELAANVAEGGDGVEEMARMTNKDDPIFWFLHRPDSAEYGRYRDLVTHLKIENMPSTIAPKPLFPPREIGENQNKYSDKAVVPPLSSYQQPTIKRSASFGEEEDDASKRRRSRWGPQSGAAVPPPTVAAFPAPLMGIATNSEAPPSPASNKQDPEADTPPLMHYLPSGGVQIPPPGHMNSNFSSGVSVNIKGPPPMLTRVTRTNPQLLSYARQSYGTIDLDDEQWKQCEEAYKMNLLFQDIARKKAKDEQIAMAGKFKHEYDSDEEVDDGGTWEHKQRMKEMDKTRDWAQDLTQKAKGKHHIGDFLPPEELDKFMDKYKAVKEGRQMDESAYQDFKIAQDNVGFKLLQKMGWNDGQGLGSTGQGITAPIDKGVAMSDKQGLGIEKPSELREEDDEYAAYRKRMMLAYRFRPNPLNNPRRAYY